MRIICPRSACASIARRDQFLALLQEVADVTIAKEPRTLAYAWFKNSGEDDQLPERYVRGFEVYEDEQASTVTHRSSAAYKAMRAAVADERLLEGSSDLRFLQPTGTGFLYRVEDESIVFQRATSGHSILIHEILPKERRKSEVLLVLAKIVQDLRDTMAEVRSFWVLEYLEEYKDESLLVFAMFKSDAARDELYSSFGKYSSSWSMLKTLMCKSQISKWNESGIGFIGRA